MKRNLYNGLVIAVFIFIMGFLFLNQVYPILNDIDYNENRKKAEKPIPNIKRLDQYPKHYDEYLTDNFSLRGVFLREMSKLNSSLWNKSPKPDKIIFGKDDWLFLVDKELDCYLGKRNFNTVQLKDMLEEFRFRQQTLDAMGIRMLIVIQPTKYSIYPEYLPNSMISHNAKNSANQLIEYFKEKSNIDILYTKDILVPLKPDFQLYHKNDNHWNDLAGYYVSKEIVRRIDENIPVIPLENFCADTILNKKGNLADMTGYADLYTETFVELSICNNDAQQFSRYEYDPPEKFPYKSSYQRSYKSQNENLPNALFIRDSYAEALIPYLRNSFHYSTFIWDEWNYGFNLDIIEKEKPDVVVYMVLESLIPNIHSKGLTKK